eukprot:TRINITY_DN2622_c0_g1::TRINITY_DN2622_c0_g1_i1::g.26191::m.26191 TRINITY_DN2622_c0_g1::TRINITY_DN2622_c0_g1_i1::g.26191  ORF type:complete len:177 (-),score=7.71,zf-CCHC_6/PF15288.1/5.2,zf-CCHC_6/PF15288.1/0.061,DUF1289/PF06945.8/4.9e+02,DUF1289/PF06945.8/2.8e+03,DUF1289/PF06945.8/0.027,zf-CCHC_4/PF14392.1/0.031,zf-CCHC_4/PF14392.1/45,zf-CCHC_4/PF14392.1/7.8e+02,HNH/PF01844.18/1.3e+02,HNH/PF01844.18/76,HNH/PF01844.18/0.58,zf-CCHC/PF00098.18/2.8e+02,zf-CCHC/PF00098.18/0.08,zf-CCHC/PF00098.18/5.9e+
MVCSDCNLFGHSKNACPGASSKTCTACGKSGHIRSNSNCPHNHGRLQTRAAELDKIDKASAGKTEEKGWLITNISGTSGQRYRNSSSKTERTWLEVWRKHSGSQRATCVVFGCTREDLVGAHIRVADGSKDRRWRLTALCSGCNRMENEAKMWITQGSRLVFVRPHLRKSGVWWCC